MTEQHEVSTQHITATIALAGAQQATIATHGTPGPGSYIAVTYAGLMIWLYDQRAVTTYRTPWNEGAARIYAAALPVSRQLAATAAGGYSPTIAVRATGADRPDIYPRKSALIVQVGNITWAVYDRAAYDDQVALWRKVDRLAKLVLPRSYDRRPRRAK